ncbi:hypothetical protein Plec18170_004490 [Paecilomyces lecythidis]
MVPIAVLGSLHNAVSEGIGQRAVVDGDGNYRVREVVRVVGCNPAEVEDRIDVVRMEVADAGGNLGMEARRMGLVEEERVREEDNVPGAEDQAEEHRSLVAEDRESGPEGVDTRMGVEIVKRRAATDCESKKNKRRV